MYWQWRVAADGEAECVLPELFSGPLQSSGSVGEVGQLAVRPLHDAGVGCR